ncbi:hypothetical protein NL676_009538 [Syzygium grande]|nr:hypothetical protein NL676_009538 [Syzygium grande]
MFDFRIPSNKISRLDKWLMDFMQQKPSPLSGEATRRFAMEYAEGLWLSRLPVTKWNPPEKGSLKFNGVRRGGIYHEASGRAIAGFSDQARRHLN